MLDVRPSRAMHYAVGWGAGGPSVFVIMQLAGLADAATVLDGMDSNVAVCSIRGRAGSLKTSHC
ncbi:protein of unknown function [Hyphomicrobium sp. MC1]|nr:protein of unknown function [Hyphomicrobium sp. MC1]